MVPLHFTAHNIRLNDGRVTMPNAGRMTMEAYPNFISARNVLNLVYPGDKKGLRIVDLGCLEGGYAVEFARMGFDSLGIEARLSNFECCDFVKQNVDLPNLMFARDNVINISKYGIFDAAYCGGLLYHLDKPKAFLQQLASQIRRVMILDTHFSLNNVISSDFSLTPVIVNEGLPGRWYQEFLPETEQEKIDEFRWSAFHNASSFWPQREYLIELIYNLGFDMVFEQFDHYSPNIALNLKDGYHKFLRGTFVGIRSAK
jgi:hypothetical protein